MHGPASRWTLSAIQPLFSLSLDLTSIFISDISSFNKFCILISLLSVFQPVGTPHDIPGLSIENECPCFLVRNRIGVNGAGELETPCFTAPEISMPTDHRPTGALGLCNFTAPLPGLQPTNVSKCFLVYFSPSLQPVLKTSFLPFIIRLLGGVFTSFSPLSSALFPFLFLIH